MVAALSPCALAGNVAAVSVLGGGGPRRVMMRGMAYSAGRVLAYVAVGMLAGRRRNDSRGRGRSAGPDPEPAAGGLGWCWRASSRWGW